MKYELTTPATVYPISLEQIKQHLVVEHPNDDALINIYLAQAIEFAESKTGLHIGAQTWTVYSDDWCGVRSIPFMPVSSVTIKYRDADGILQDLDASLYTVDNKSYPTIIEFTDPESLPDLDDGPNVVQAVVDTGYTTIPRTIEAAVYLITGHLYERREDTSVVAIHAIPMGAESFLNAAKVNFL